ncbi:MAG: hypothetical protein GY951_18525 [Psychromonas sp.]|nr:hypothetical protein [Alteromonadales bacterium]MCP5080027.1 hypothetical protein [Psychromonas sp.]
MTVEKLQALIQYGESTLPEYGISITAQLIQQPKNNTHSASSYQLSNIKLNDQSPHNAINLLSPWFHNSYICNPVCSQLTEYKSETNQGATTLLNYYFQLHQFEFYDFYVEIYKLNRKIEQLQEIQPLLLKDYLLYLVDQQAPQTSLMDFIALLTQSLSTTAYQYYLQQPTLRVGKYISSTANEQNIWILNQSNTESAEWQKTTSKNSETEEWQKTPSENAEVQGWRENSSESAETQPWKNADESNIHKHISNPHKQPASTVIIPSPTQWKATKSNNLDIGDIACSYHGNMFGKVIALHNASNNKNKTVSLSLLGEVKNVHDGIIKNQISGYLFNTSQSVINFKPIKGVKVFFANNISKCQFK